MFVIRFLLVLIGFPCLFACKGEKEVGEYKMVETGEVELFLDSFTSPVEEYSQYLADWKGKEAFVVHVRGKDQLKFYDLESGNLYDSLKYQTSGPGSLRGIYDFHVVNEDSIFMNQRYGYKMFLTDGKLNILNTYSFLPEGTSFNAYGRPRVEESFLVVFDRNRMFEKVGDKVIVSTVPDKDYYTRDFYDSESIIISLDLKTGDYQPVLGYPEKVKNKIWGPFHSNVYGIWNPTAQKAIFSFAADESLFTSDFRQTDEWALSSSYLDKVRPMDNPDRQQEAYWKYFMETPVYGPVFHDSYRDCYYRLGKMPNANYEIPVMRDLMANPRDLVVLVYDSEFNKIVETLIPQPEKGIFMDACFVNKNGLNIQYVDLNNEDKLYFKTFSLKPAGFKSSSR